MNKFGTFLAVLCLFSLTGLTDGLPNLAGMAGLNGLADWSRTGEAQAARKLAPGSSRAERNTQAEKKPLKPENFAHSITLTGEPGSMLEIALPESVYLGLRRPDHRDICVFDSQGLPTPFALSSQERESAPMHSDLTLKFFPWRPAPAAGGDAAGERTAPTAGDIEINSGGSIIRIKGQGSQSGQSRASGRNGQAPEVLGTEGEGSAPRPGFTAGPAYYLIDMDAYLQLIASKAAGGNYGNLRHARLLLESEAEGDFTCYVSMQTSGNLDDWQNIGQRQTLARVRHGENVLARDNLSVPPGTRRYLLLKLEGEAILPKKISATLEFSQYSSLTALRAVSGAISEDRRSVIYDLGGYFSLSELDFELPGSEIINVRLSSSNSPEQGWRFQGTHLLYRMFGDGESVGSEPIRLNSRDRYWRLDARGDFPFAEAPVLKAAWHPARLSFLSRGQGLWTLAFGGKDAVEQSPMPASGIAQAREATILSAGPEEPEIKPEPPKADDSESREQWILWGVLILGVAALLGIALWLARSMRKK